jgi:hypothetical protein
VPSGPFGRTNQVFPPVWLRLSVPSFATDLEPLADAALESGAPIDVTTSPGLWGGYMRSTDAVLTCVSSTDFERSTDDRHANDLIQAHLIETLSCIGRDYFDFYFLRIRRAIEEYQISGALEALEVAKQEGHIRFLGLACDGPALATLSMWQFHDAFDVVLLPDDAYSTLAPMARERRVGVLNLTSPSTVRRHETDAKLVGVSTATEVIKAVRHEVMA